MNQSCQFTYPTGKDEWMYCDPNDELARKWVFINTSFIMGEDNLLSDPITLPIDNLFNWSICHVWQFSFAKVIPTSTLANKFCHSPQVKRIARRPRYNYPECDCWSAYDSGQWSTHVERGINELMFMNSACGMSGTSLSCWWGQLVDRNQHL